MIDDCHDPELGKDSSIDPLVIEVAAIAYDQKRAQQIRLILGVSETVELIGSSATSEVPVFGGS